MGDNPHPPSADGPGYDGFISYSRVDVTFAAALEHALERYRPPRGLGPSRRLRIFRDEGDLTGSEYGSAIDRLLADSAKLILVCSPDARRSRWVDDEIRRFLGRRGAENVIPLLVNGIPNNEGDPGDARHAFPEPLMEAMGIPLATSFLGFDAAAGDRPDKGRFAGAWHTLLANLLDVSREEIEERERVHRARTLRRVVGGSTVLLSVMGALTTWALISAASERRARFDAQARLLELRAVDAMNGSVAELTDPVAPLLMAREALALAQRADEGQRLPGAEGVIHRALALRPGRGLAGWQNALPRQTAYGPWTAMDPGARWLVTGDLAADFARVWDLHAGEPGTTGRLLEDTQGAYFLGDWLLTAGAGGALLARRVGAWESSVSLLEARGYPPPAVFTPVPDDGSRVVVHVGTRTVVVDATRDSVQAFRLPELEPGLPGMAGRRWIVRREPGSLWVVDLEDPDRVLQGEAAHAALRDGGVHAFETRNGLQEAAVLFVDDPELRPYPGVLGPDGRSAIIQTEYESPVLVRGDSVDKVLDGAARPFARVGDRVLAAHVDGGVGVWRVTGQDGAPLRRWPDVGAGFSVSPDGSWLLAGAPGLSEDGGVQADGPLDGQPSFRRLYRLDADMERGPAIPYATTRAGAFAVFTPDGRWMVELGLRAHQLIDLAGVSESRGFASELGAAAWMPNSDVLYTAHADGTVRRWSPGQPGMTRSVEVMHGPELASLLVSPDEAWLLGEPGAGGLALWRRRGDGFEAVPEFEVSPDLYGSLDWSGSRGFRGLWDELAYYNGGHPLVGGGRPARELPLRFEPEARALLAARADGAWLRWDLDAPGVAPDTVAAPAGWVPAGPAWAVREGAGDSLEVSSVRDPDSPFRRFAGPVAVPDPRGAWVATRCAEEAYQGSRPVFSPDGRWLMTWRGLWDLEYVAEAGAAAEDRDGCTLRPLTGRGTPPLELTLAAAIPWPDKGGGSFIAGSAFSPDGRWLVVRYSYRGFGGCGYGAEFQLMDLAAADPSTTLAPLQSFDPLGCTEVQFSPSTRWLATGGVLWDLGSAQPSAQPVALGGEVVAFHPSERLVAVSVDMGGQATLRFVTLDVPTLLAEVCRRAGRNLSAEEWRAAFPGEAYRPLCPDAALPPSPGSPPSAAG